ncbi:MAG: hypothetical protein M0R17_00600 [Candidatus Omnitrophica bacterium]|jgi:hypothetical protein|nr:hypothetical protein [Candidatus Omnitrophota bacterium]
MFNRLTLTEALTVFDNGHTVDYEFDTKEYIKCLIYAMKIGTKASYEGSKGQHVGQNVSPSALTTIVNQLMLFNPYSIKGGANYSKLVNKQNKNNIQLLPKFPNLAKYKPDSAKLKYIENNPFFSKYLNDSIMKKYIEDYYISFDEEEHVYLPTTKAESNMYIRFVNFLKKVKLDKLSDELNDWIRIVSAPYISGDDRYTIAQAIDFFETNNKSLFNAYRANESVGEEYGPLGAENFNEILIADDKLSFGINKIDNLVPSNYKNNVKNDISHNSSFDLGNGLISLLYVGYFTIDRVNDVNAVTSSKGETSKANVFFKIEPDENGKYTQYPGSIRLVISISHGSEFNATPNQVFEIMLGSNDYKELFNLNAHSNNVLSGKTFGPSDSHIFGFQFPIDLIKRMSPAGNLVIEPKNFNITAKKTAKPVEEPIKKPNAFEGLFDWIKE